MIKLRVKEILKERGMTAKSLAESLGITEVGLSKAIGENGNPPLKRLQEIAQVLSVEVWELFTEVRDKSEFIALIKNGNEFYQATTMKELENIVEKLKDKISQGKDLQV